MAYPKGPNCINPHPILRRSYDLVSNIRPSRSCPAVPCINPNVGLVTVRENNEDFLPDRNMYSRGSGAAKKVTAVLKNTVSSLGAGFSSTPAVRWPRTIRTSRSRRSPSTPSP